MSLARAEHSPQRFLQHVFKDPPRTRCLFWYVGSNAEAG